VTDGSRSPGARSAHKERALLKRLLRERAGRPTEAPLSFGQERIWFLDQLAPASSAYCETIAARLNAVVSPPVLDRALNEVVRRHEILRTTFGAVAGRPVQRIAAELRLRAPVVDLTELDRAAQTAELRRAIATRTERAFDLGRGPLLRLTLLKLNRREHYVVLSFHHIVGDAWSVGVLLRELFAAYLFFSAGSRLPLPEPPIQYADFARWQRRRLERGKLDAQLARLKESLVDLPILELPTDRPRPALQSLRGATFTFAFPEELRGALEAVSGGERATLFMTSLMAFQLLLSRYTGSEDIVVGSPVAGRDHAALQGLIGFFANMVLLRASLRGDPTLRELLRRVRQACLDAYAHQDVPFEKLVEELRPERSLSQTPLFQVVFAHLRDLMTAPDVPGIDYEPIEIDARASKFDLTMYTWKAKHDHGLMGTIEYGADLFDAATVARMAGHYSVLLRAIAGNPEKRISELSLLRDEERQQLLFEWKAPGAEYPALRLSESFERQVERAADSVAAVFEGEHLSYGELNRRSDRLARHLRTLGVAPDAPVAVCLERSLEMVVGVLSILKSGGAYVPLDPSYPPERLRFMLGDSGAKVVVTHESLARDLMAFEVRPVALDAGIPRPGGEGEIHAGPEAAPSNLAYLMYTSGSTGRPKGVAVTHKNVARLFQAIADRFDFGAADTWTLFHSYAFDFSVWELWGALLHGGRLVVVPHWVSRSPEAFHERLRLERVTVLNQTPSAFFELAKVEERLGGCPALRLVIFGGEALELKALGSWFERHGDRNPRLVNMYGITEATVHVTYRALAVEDLARATGSPIGRAIPDLSLYVLDRQQQLAPIGVPGELCVGGPGLARGYLGQPKLTAERFIPDPFAPIEGETGGRLYRTGDRARWSAEGELSYLGRFDHQVKVRGFRIELGEVESALREHPAVGQAVVAAMDEPALGVRLVAYVVARGEPKGLPDDDELCRHLKAKLPEYMVPSLYERLESLPLTPAGKVDRRALPAPSARRTGKGYVAPRTAVELELARIWSEVLKVDRVGVEDSFFELGGHSLMATQLWSRVREAFRVDLPLVRLFEKPTITGLAELLVVDSVEPNAARGPDLRREAVLDPSITFVPAARPALPPRNVFLTGGTGFLGASLLHDLLLTTKANVHCLVRAANAEEATNRVQAALESLSLDSLDLRGKDGAMSRIIPVPGDLSRPYLGLASEDFDALASRVDAIYHSGAMVSALYPYSVHKPTNVLGTGEVLRLSSRIRVKPLHYVSATSVATPTPDVSSSAIGEEIDLDDMGPPKDGYSQSKWVAERIVVEARSRGLPVVIYRPGRISGHSRTGVGNDDDLFSRLLKLCVQLGRVPELEAPVMTDIVPVDYVSQALVHLSTRESSLGRVFHLVNPRPTEWSRVIEWIAELGYPLRPVPCAQWIAERNALFEGSEDRLLAALDSSSLSGSNGSLLQVPRFDSRNTLDALEGTAIVCPPVDARLLATYVSHWVRSGYLPPPPSERGRITAADGLQGTDP
jgi:amino acid adenylation domain-containing protein/thioester reductase-like protein